MLAQGGRGLAREAVTLAGRKRGRLGHANRHEESPGLSRLEEIQHAAPMRLRPILITTLLATLGLVPIALGFAEGPKLLRPLALVTHPD